jgi:hypothetical protein
VRREGGERLTRESGLEGEQMVFFIRCGTHHIDYFMVSHCEGKSIARDYLCKTHQYRLLSPYALLILLPLSNNVLIGPIPSWMDTVHSMFFAEKTS